MAQQEFPDDFLERPIDHLTVYDRIGEKTIAQLRLLGIETVGDLYNRGEDFFFKAEFTNTVKHYTALQSLMNDYRTQQAAKVAALNQTASENESGPSTSEASVIEPTAVPSQSEEEINFAHLAAQLEQAMTLLDDVKLKFEKLQRKQ